ncbi:MAG: YhfC family intramembrane metalloprotease [Lachnospiraceae bacterium]|nr:YhfC family intramembrane metalloprotease [Lachnospiraceae bacterium]
MDLNTAAGALPVSVLVFIALTIVLSIIVPVAFFIHLRNSGPVSFRPVLAGMAAFIIAVMVLERMLHLLVLQVDSPVSRFLSQGGVINALCYGLYGAFAAGIFEETARYIAYTTYLKQANGRRIPLLYGIGHGGMEAFLICTLPMLANFVTAAALRRRGLDDFLSGYPAADAAVLRETFTTFYTTPAASYLLAGVERILAFAIHVSLSVLVYIAVKNVKRRLLFPYAIMIHAVVDFVPALYQAGLITSVALVETYTAVSAIFLVFLARVLYKKNLMNLPEL